MRYPAVSLIVLNSFLLLAFLGLNSLDLDIYRSQASDAVFFPGNAQLVIQDDEAERAFTGPAMEHMTFLQALYAAAIGSSLDFKFSNEGEDVKILSLNKKINNGKTWHFYLNGREIDPTQLDQNQVRPLDVLKASYQ